MTKRKEISIKPHEPDSVASKALPIDTDTIKKLKDMRGEKLNFSFRFFDRTHKYFNLSKTCVEWYYELLNILKEVSNLTYLELSYEQRQHYDTHPIKWETASAKIEESLMKQHEFIQFRISKSKGRVHGFVVGNCFFVVWFDPHHNLFPDNKYGGIKNYLYSPSCYELLLEKIRVLEKENHELTSLLDDYTK